MIPGMASQSDNTADAASTEPATASGFFYGTLMAPEVFYTVCYRTEKPLPALVKDHSFRPAVLPGYSRHRIKGEDYPGVIADTDETAGNTVRGFLVSGLTAANLYHLDVFEGSEYDRKTVNVKVDGIEALSEAQVYIFKDANRLEPKEWDFDEFRREKMRSWTRADLTFEGTN